MKKKVSDILENNVLILITGKDYISKRASLSERDYRGQRFLNNDKNLLNFVEILSLTKPSAIGEIDERFLKSGTDIVITNTAKANRYYLQKYGIEDTSYELNLAGAKIARDKVTKYSHLTRNKPRFVAGCISSVPDDLDFDYVKSIYSEQFKPLLAGKVDLIFMQEMENEQSLKAALAALNSILEKRKKNIEVFITIDNDELIPWTENKDLSSEYSFIEIVAVGITNQDNNSVGKLSESPFKIISLLNNKEKSDEYYFEETKNLIDKKLTNVLVYDVSIPPQTIENIIGLLN